MAVQRALISVFDKTGIMDFAKRLAAMKIEILSTGGTAKLLRENVLDGMRDTSGREDQQHDGCGQEEGGADGFLQGEQRHSGRGARSSHWLNG